MLRFFFGLCLFAPVLVSAAAPVDPLGVFDKTTSLVSKHFYDRSFRGLDWERLVHESRGKICSRSSDEELKDTLNNLLAKLNASHTSFLSASDQEYWALKSIFSGKIDSAPIWQIGAWFVKQGEKWFVQNVFAGGAADAAGILPGDEILSVNGNPFFPIDSFSNGKLHSLSLKRTANSAPIEIKIRPRKESIQRSLLRATEKSFRILRLNGKRIAYFHLWSGTNEAFQSALRLAAKKAKGESDAFILDLRDGFGGAHPEYLEPFMASPGGTAALYDKPMIALINGGVRSGKEWVTHVLKEEKRALLIGSRTKGYFLAGMPFEVLKDRFMLFLAVEEDPSMPKLEGNGVFPDLEVSFELPYSGGHDPILEAALRRFYDF